MRSPKKKTERPHSVDELMRNTARALIRDFRTNLNDPGFCSSYDRSLACLNLQELRDSAPAPDFEDDNIARFKATYQIQSVLKRYRFQKDLYTDDELTQKAITSFEDTQVRIRQVDWSSLSAKTNAILDLASDYIRSILGPYDCDEHSDLCRFGRRASVGIPAREASEAARWELPISGSPEQISWFSSEMMNIDCVQEYWRKQLESDPQRSVFHEVDSLKLALVPKTFKSLRSIMPNTTIGSYMSYGLGEMIRKRLRAKGYDIKTLQMRHRVLARLGSRHTQYATLDLSSASDSISVAMVDRLFPPDWLAILHQSRIGRVVLPDNRCVESETFCTMGIGYTFPLQTLVFLSILKAASFYSFGKRKMTISVYGDDMIYNVILHSHILDVFSEIGLVVNIEKSYHTGYFRESCGGDYFRGVDVRPFQPRNGSASVGKTTYEAILYKYINGLLMRWSEYEIRFTLDYLLSELASVTGKAKIVPDNFPDDSGIKVSFKSPFDFLKGREDVVRPKHLGHGVFRFPYLRLVSDLKEEKRHEPYLWCTLRGHASPPIDYSGDRVSGRTLPFLSLVEQETGVDRVQEPLLITREVKPHQTFRSKLTGRRLRRQSTFLTVSHTGRYKRQSGTSCF